MKQSGLTLFKGVLIVLGGAALGFFGCVGGLSIDSEGLAVGAAIVGGIAVIVGVVVTIIGFVQVFAGMVKPKE